RESRALFQRSSWFRDRRTARSFLEDGAHLLAPEARERLDRAPEQTHLPTGSACTFRQTTPGDEVPLPRSQFHHTCLRAIFAVLYQDFRAAFQPADRCDKREPGFRGASCWCQLAFRME